MPPKITYYLKTNIFPYTILKYDTNKHKNIFNGRVTASTISNIEIKEIEKLIKKRVDIYNRNNKSGIVKPEKYFKQFIAIINAKDEKLVWVNCMCEVIDNDWKKRVPLVNDGGNCYFQLRINLTKKLVYDFHTNGLG